MILRLFTPFIASILVLSPTVGALFRSATVVQTRAPKLSRSQAGFYRLKIGEVDLIALSDGTVPLPTLDVLTDVQPGEVERLLAAAFQKPLLDASVNAYLIVPGSRLVLVDTGAGELYGPTLNKLPASLAAAGYKPEQITDILITHIHTDHSGGLMDGDRQVFPNAVVHVDRREIDFWLSPANLQQAEEGRKKYFREAAAKVKPYLDAGRVKAFNGDTQLFPGIRAIASPGHTPGHSFYALESKGEKIVFWGDIMHVAEAQFPNPSITITFDVDSKAAAARRRRAYADAAKSGYLVAPAHVSFPGIGHLRADGNGYRWVPIPYLNDAY
jgi:glyoxylase-like metal-dependent hydrolase (beta-lactamase superfamily II)